MSRPALRHFVLLLAILTLLLPGGCGTTPYTDRNQILLLPAATESQLGVQAYQEALAGERLSTNAQWSAWVQNVGQRIAAVAAEDGFGLDFQWEYNVIASPTINAFATPGGKVAFYEGIMPICQSETGVAVVMGHEVAHAIARHGGERISQSIIAQGGMELINQILAGSAPQYAPAVSEAMGIGVGVGMLGFSRSHESEADEIGLRLMARAGYDPREAPLFWARMDQANSGGPRSPEFLSTHPHPDTRIRDLEALVPQFMPLYENSPYRGRR